jgi:hypothetical protein
MLHLPSIYFVWQLICLWVLRKYRKWKINLFTFTYIHIYCIDLVTVPVIFCWPNSVKANSKFYVVIYLKQNNLKTQLQGLFSFIKTHE